MFQRKGDFSVRTRRDGLLGCILFQRNIRCQRIPVLLRQGDREAEFLLLVAACHDLADIQRAYHGVGEHDAVLEVA